MMRKTRFGTLLVAALWLGIGATAVDAASLAGIDTDIGNQGPIVRLELSDQVETVHYSPQPGVWIIDLPADVWEGAPLAITDQAVGVERAQVAHVEEFGRTVTRVTVWLAESAPLDIQWTASGLDLVFAKATAALEPETIELAEVVGEELASIVEPESAPVIQTDEPEAIQVAEVADTTPLVTEVLSSPSQPMPVAADAPAAGNLFELRARNGSDGIAIDLIADGVLSASQFVLPDPLRLVVDLKGVVLRTQIRQLDLGGSGVNQLRVAQFKTVPTPVTRIVLDLAEDVDHRFVSTATGGRLEIGTPQPSMTVAPAPTQVAQLEAAPATAAEASETDRLAEALDAWNSADSTAPAGIIVVGGNQIDAEPIETAVQSTEPDWDEALISETDTVVSSVTPVSPYIETAVQDVAVQDIAVEQPVELSRDDVANDPFIADPTQLLERADAGEEILEETTSDYEILGDDNSPKYTGTPLTMTLKDADIKDVLRTFAELTGLNVVVDPGVTGSVTVELHEVPWDQALDLILKINGLDYVLENNVLRVANEAKIKAERRTTADDLESELEIEALRTVTMRTSYAEAKDIATTIKAADFLLSPRGSIVVDSRTQTLILRDVTSRLENIVRIIQELDQPNPQVIIEARIVETTRTYSRTLGFNWGFATSLGPETGTDTGLDFPNTIDGFGRVTLDQPGVGNIGFTFGDILNTFNLDFTLSAAESEGLVKVVSSPKVTAQNNQTAKIQSGVQIPIQTVQNNTVTVTYVDATLSLTVKPRINADGTVLLDVNIQKKNPTTGLQQQGGTNAPIQTREAQTKVLVADGGTTVIGGIYQITDNNAQNGVPGLRRIPLLKWIFGTSTLQSTHDELLIFITPRVVKY